MKKEKSLEIIDAEIARWVRMKEIINAFEKGKMYKILFKYTERYEKIPGDWKSIVWIPRESVFIGTLKEYNKASINFEVLTIKDVEKSDFRYKLSTHANMLATYRRQLKDLENIKPELSEQQKKDKKRYLKNINKKFHCSIALDSFLSWDEWVPNVTEAPLMVNHEFISEGMRKKLFGV
jgi:hypothetical protein